MPNNGNREEERSSVSIRFPADPARNFLLNVSVPMKRAVTMTREEEQQCAAFEAILVSGMSDFVGRRVNDELFAAIHASIMARLKIADELIEREDDKNG